MIVAFSIAGHSPDASGSSTPSRSPRSSASSASRACPRETNAMFTNVEGEWDEVMAVVKRCVDAMTAHSPRVSLVVKADIRPGHTGMLTSKVARIDEVLGEG